MTAAVGVRLRFIEAEEGKGKKKVGTEGNGPKDVTGWRALHG